MEIDNKYDIIIEGDDNNDSEALKEEYQEVISQLRHYKLDYDFIRKVLTIVSSLVIEYDFNTPEALKQTYEETHLLFFGCLHGTIGVLCRQKRTRG